MQLYFLLIDKIVNPYGPAPPKKKLKSKKEVEELHVMLLEM